MDCSLQEKKIYFFFWWNKSIPVCGKSPMQVNWKLINSKVTRWVSVDKLWKSRNSSHLFAKLIWYFNGDLSFCLVPKLVFSYNTTAVMKKLQSHTSRRYISKQESKVEILKANLDSWIRNGKMRDPQQQPSPFYHYQNFPFFSSTIFFSKQVLKIKRLLL